MASPSFRQIMRQVFHASRDSLQVTHAVTGIGSGSKVLIYSGTPETLVSTPTSFKFVDIQARSSNTGVIAVGGSNVRGTPSSSPIGIVLTPLSSVRFEGDDLQDIYVSAEVAAEGVNFTYYT